MTVTAAKPTTARHTDTGLLSPGWAGVDAVESVSDDAFVNAMLNVEVALARAQAELGIIPADAADVIAGVRAEQLERGGLVAGVRATANPVVGFVGQLTELVAGVDPAAADHVHRGGTSQDILDTAEMLLADHALRLVRNDLDRVAAALAELVARHRSTPSVARTLTQHAVPTTFGAKAAGWLDLVLDVGDRLDRLLAEGLPVSLGGAAGTLAAYVEYARLADRDIGVGGAALTGAFAARLGLRAPAVPWHAVRTPIADLAAVLSFAAVALGKLAADVQVLSRTEIGELTEPAAAGRGASSAMPQKRNPVLATLIVTAARQVPAYALVLSQSVVAEDERSAGAWHAEWQALRDCLRLVVGASANAAELVEGVQVHPAAMAANLRRTGGAVVSERLAAVLAPVLGKAAAKAALADVTRHAEATGEPLIDVLTAELAARGHELTRERAAQLLDPVRYLGCAADVADRVLARHRGGG